MDDKIKIIARRLGSFMYFCTIMMSIFTLGIVVVFILLMVNASQYMGDSLAFVIMLFIAMFIAVIIPTIPLVITCIKQPPTLVTEAEGQLFIHISRKKTISLNSLKLHSINYNRYPLVLPFFFGNGVALVSGEFLTSGKIVIRTLNKTIRLRFVRNIDNVFHYIRYYESSKT